MSSWCTADRFRPARWFALALVCCSGAFVSTASAQDRLSKVKELYTAASYEEALALLDEIEVAGETLETSEYRVLCLFGLGQVARAQAAIERLTLSHPEYKPDPQRMSPSVRAQFAAVRTRLLPQIISDVYAEGKSNYDAKDHRTAVVLFDLLLDLLNDAQNDPRAPDLRVIVTGFRDRARASLTSQAALPARSLDLAQGGPIGTSGLMGRAAGGANRSAVGSPGWASAGDVSIYDASARDVNAPVPVKPILPPSVEWATPTASPGLFEIVIDETGRVESVTVRRSIDPKYDALVLREARGWQYQPATRNGVAVKFRKVIEIYTTPLASIPKR